MERLNIIPETDDYDEPLAIKVGAWADDIQAEGWPDTFVPEVIERILSYLPKED